MMGGTAAVVLDLSAFGKASVSWPSCSRVTPPGPAPCRIRRCIVSAGGLFQSQAITDQPTQLIPSSCAPEITCGPYQPCGTRKMVGTAPVALWMASCPRESSSLTVLLQLQVRCGWVKVWLPTACSEATSAARLGSRTTLFPTIKKVACIPSLVNTSMRPSVYGWQGPSSKVSATTRSSVLACQKTG